MTSSGPSLRCGRRFLQGSKGATAARHTGYESSPLTPLRSPSEFPLSAKATQQASRTLSCPFYHPHARALGTSLHELNWRITSSQIMERSGKFLQKRNIGNKASPRRERPNSSMKRKLPTKVLRSSYNPRTTFVLPIIRRRVFALCHNIPITNPASPRQ
jgi:hypothetical protein